MKPHKLLFWKSMKSTMGTAALLSAILTGGRSSRMGQPKAGVRLASGRTLLEHVASSAQELGWPCIAVGLADGLSGDQYLGLEVLPDEMLARGPLGALHALFRNGRAAHYLVLSCDQPLVQAKLLRKLTERLDERPNVFACAGAFTPLPGLYPASILSTVEQALASPKASLRALLERHNYRSIVISPDEWQLLRGANTAADVAELNRMLTQRPE